MLVKAARRPLQFYLLEILNAIIDHANSLETGALFVSLNYSIRNL